MGTARTYNKETKNLSEHLYESIGDAFYVDGLKCKVIKLKTDSKGARSNLPWYSNSSDVYIVLGKDGYAKQLRIYKDHEPYKDIEWGHNHINRKTDGKVFPKYTVHVQEYQIDTERKGSHARYLNNDEIETWGEIIKKLNPNTKLR